MKTLAKVRSSFPVLAITSRLASCILCFFNRPSAKLNGAVRAAAIRYLNTTVHDCGVRNCRAESNRRDEKTEIRFDVTVYFEIGSSPETRVPSASTKRSFVFQKTSCNSPHLPRRPRSLYSTTTCISVIAKNAAECAEFRGHDAKQGATFTRPNNPHDGKRNSFATGAVSSCPRVESHNRTLPGILVTQASSADADVRIGKWHIHGTDQTSRFPRTLAGGWYSDGNHGRIAAHG